MNSSEITDWDAWEVMWSKAMEMSHCSDRPILSTDQGFSPDGQKAKMTEVMFEKFQVPAFFIGHTAALSAFSLGRHTALVVDCGGGGCTATPVIDGMILKNSLKRSLRGGDFLDGRIKEVRAGVRKRATPTLRDSESFARLRAPYAPFAPRALYLTHTHTCPSLQQQPLAARGEDGQGSFPPL